MCHPVAYRNGSTAATGLCEIFLSGIKRKDTPACPEHSVRKKKRYFSHKLSLYAMKQKIILVFFMMCSDVVCKNGI